MRPLFAHALSRLEFTSKANFHMSYTRCWRSENITSRQEARCALTSSKMAGKTDYSAWSHESLIERVTKLELELKNKNQRCNSLFYIEKTDPR